MQNKTSLQKAAPILILTLSVLVAIYWGIGKLVNVYSSSFVGAVFEILWLPMLLLLFVLPAASAFYWYKNLFKLNSVYFFSLLISVASLVMITMSN